MKFEKLTAEQIRIANAIIDATKPDELPGFKPESGDSQEDGHLNGHARVRTFFRMNCEESLTATSHIIAAFDGYHVEDIRNLLREAVSSGEFTVSLQVPTKLDPDGFVFFERSEILRLITSRTELTPGFLCEILTESDSRRDAPTETKRPVGEITSEYHIPSWLLEGMLTAAKESRGLETQKDRRLLWRAPIEDAS